MLADLLDVKTELERQLHEVCAYLKNLDLYIWRKFQPNDLDLICPLYKHHKARR
jgi:hypothetical protein